MAPQAHDREKVIGKRKGKTERGRSESFFLGSAAGVFCGRGGRVERVTDFFQKKIGTSVTRLDDVLALDKMFIFS